MTKILTALKKLKIKSKNVKAFESLVSVSYIGLVFNHQDSIYIVVGRKDGQYKAVSSDGSSLLMDSEQLRIVVESYEEISKEIERAHDKMDTKYSKNVGKLGVIVDEHGPGIIVERYFRPDYDDTTASKKGLLVKRLGLIEPSYLWIEPDRFKMCEDSVDDVIGGLLNDSYLKFMSDDADLNQVDLLRFSAILQLKNIHILERLNRLALIASAHQILGFECDVYYDSKIDDISVNDSNDDSSSFDYDSGDEGGANDEEDEEDEEKEWMKAKKEAIDKDLANNGRKDQLLLRYIIDGNEPTQNRHSIRLGVGYDKRSKKYGDLSCDVLSVRKAKAEAWIKTYKKEVLNGKRAKMTAAQVVQKFKDEKWILPSKGVYSTTKPLTPEQVKQKREKMEKELRAKLQSMEEFVDYVRGGDRCVVKKGFAASKRRGLPMFHVSATSIDNVLRWRHSYWLRDKKSYRNWWHDQPIWIKEIVRDLNAKQTLMPEYMLTFDKLLAFVHENIAPHINRQDNAKLRKNRPKKSVNCYILCDLAKAVVNNCFQDDRKKYYGWKNERYGREKLIFVFKNRKQIAYFEQVDQGPHKFMGKSPYGIEIEGIIKVVMSEDSDDLCDAEWTWIKNLPANSDRESE